MLLNYYFWVPLIASRYVFGCDFFPKKRRHYYFILLSLMNSTILVMSEQLDEILLKLVNPTVARL